MLYQLTTIFPDPLRNCGIYFFDGKNGWHIWPPKYHYFVSNTHLVFSWSVSKFSLIPIKSKWLKLEERILDHINHLNAMYKCCRKKSASSQEVGIWSADCLGVRRPGDTNRVYTWSFSESLNITPSRDMKEMLGMMRTQVALYTNYTCSAISQNM